MSDKVLFLQLHTKAGKLNNIQMYAPYPADEFDEETEQFYITFYFHYWNRSATIILGDFDSKIGEGKMG